MLTFIDINATKTVPIDAAGETTVTVGMLSATARAHIKNLVKEDITNYVGQLEAVRYGVRAWTGLRDAAGNQVEPKFQSYNVPGSSKTDRGLTEESLNGLNGDFLRKACSAVIELNFVTEETEKN